ncbi:hypothetical protein LQJ75_000772 [Shigella flexneri]|nr:hypothetical protein [Shigella flexneri]
MSKPSLYLPSKPVKYELKRQLIPTDVLVEIIPVIMFTISTIIGFIILEHNKNASREIIFLLMFLIPLITPFLLVPINWVGYWYQGRHYRKRVREWKAQCKKIKKEHQLKLNMYEFNEIMKFVKESRCKSQN